VRGAKGVAPFLLGFPEEPRPARPLAGRVGASPDRPRPGWRSRPSTLPARSLPGAKSDDSTVREDARSDGKTRSAGLSSRAVRTLGPESSRPARAAGRSGPARPWMLRVATLSPAHWAPRTGEFSEEPRERLDQRVEPALASTHRGGRDENRTRCLTLPSTHWLSTMSR